MDYLSRSYAIDARHQAVDVLMEIWRECQLDNWDGHQALPVSQEILRNAYWLIQALPLGFPAPSIGAEPDGEITLEWYRSRIRTISISVAATGVLHYAALFGSNQHFGTVAFYEQMPSEILDLIQRVIAK
jgi:hypothetical protein